MTILLIFSLANACLQIFGNLGTCLTAPMMSQMLANGELIKEMEPVFTILHTSDEEINLFLQILEDQLSISKVYYLLTALLYIGSLVGVVMMFRLQRTGFHVYSISQMLLLIVAVVYIYSHETSGFFSEFLLTAMLILIYHLFFKRIENDPTKREQDIQP